MASGDHADTKVTFLKSFLDSPGKRRLKAILISHLYGISTWMSSCTFENCNAADATGPSFSEASCSMRDNDLYREHICSFFERGIEMVHKFVEEQKLPETDNEKDALYYLTQYLNSEDDHKAIEQMSKPNIETAYSIVLANHLLSKLSVDKRYLLDLKTSGKIERKVCPCGCATEMKDHFGDTSIGEESVWHGNLDIVLLDSSVLVAPRPSSFVEVKKHKGSVQSFSQFVAQTVVFSFYHNATYPEEKKSLVPSMVFGGHEFCIAMFDSKNDVFLLSESMNLVSVHCSLWDAAIFCIWLVLNHKITGSGLPEGDQPVPKADFLKLAERKLDVYQSHLVFGCVPAVRKRKLFEDSRKRNVSELSMSKNCKKIKAFYMFGDQ